MNVIKEAVRIRTESELVLGETYAQNVKKAPAATRTPTMVAPTPVTLRAPLLLPLPLKEPPVGMVVEEDEEDVPGVEFEPKLEVVEVERPEL